MRSHWPILSRRAITDVEVNASIEYALSGSDSSNSATGPAGAVLGRQCLRAVL